MDNAVEHAHRAARQNGIGPQTGSLQSRGQRDHLEHGTRLVGRGHSPIEPRVARFFPFRRFVGIEAGIAGHGQDLAVLGIHHHDGAGPDAGLLHSFLQVALCGKLNALVDAEHQIRPDFRRIHRFRFDAFVVNVGQNFRRALPFSAWSTEPTT